MAISPEGYEKAVWQSCGSPRSVVVVEVNGYTIEPGVDLYGANLSAANLAGADLSGAFTDQTTRWPKGFDPVAAGVIFE